MSEGGAVPSPLRFGIIGSPVAHSLSPALHGAFATVLGIELRYERFEVPDPRTLTRRVRALQQEGLRGLNVTVPHKVAASRLCARLGDVARRLGAVNTLVLAPPGAAGNPVRFGENTDAAGFGRALDEAEVPCGGRFALVLGAGGAARAVVLALLERGAAVRVVARRTKQAEALRRCFDPGAPLSLALWPPDPETVLEAAIIVNATPLGMHPHEESSPLERFECLSPHHTVIDLVYNPLETKLLAGARANGARALDGLGMLVHQGIDALALWLGRRFEPPLRRRLAAAGRARLEQRLVSRTRTE